MTVLVSKALGYVVNKFEDTSVSKALGYVIHEFKDTSVSKALGYIVLKDADVVVDDQVRISKALQYAVMIPGPYGPPTRVTSIGLDYLYSGGLPTARISASVLDALVRKSSEARVSGSVAEVLTQRIPAAFVSGAVLEVLRSTAEVTVSAFISTLAIDVFAKPAGTNALVSGVVIEVLMPAVDNNAIGSVWAIG